MRSKRTCEYGVLMPVKRKRAWELDFLRGVAVIAMCFDHLMFDLGHFKSWFSNSATVSVSWLDKLRLLARDYWATGYYSDPGFRFYAHYIFVTLFLLLVGVSCAFSRDNTRRGSLLALVALAFTGVTFVLREFGIMQYGVVFGILHCIALSILIAASVDLLTKGCKPLNVYLPLVLGVAILSVGLSREFYKMSFDKTFDWEHMLDYIVGFRGYGDDWFGLLPYCGTVLVGMYFGKAAYPERKSLLPRLDGVWNKPINFVGRHALVFYLAHQVVMAGIVIVLGLICGYRL